MIHYNYCGAISTNGTHGFLQFLWARFARLYPLFVVVVIADILLGNQFYNSLVGDLGPGLRSYIATFPYLMTFTQSWFYEIIGNHVLIYQIGNATQLTWSISTEWFFYPCYPITMFATLRVRKPLYATLTAVA